VESFLYTNAALELGAEITVLSRDPEGFLVKKPHLRADKALHLIAGDVRNFNFPRGGFDWVIHAAMDPGAATRGENALETLDLSYTGTRRMLDFCKSAKTRKYLFVSSGAVYGKQPAELTLIEEEFTGAPDLNLKSSAYGEGKRIGEWLSRFTAETQGFEAKIARCFAFVGPGLPLDAHYAVGNFIRQGLNQEDIIIKGHGQSLRSYMYASDMAVWLWHILFKGQSGVAYNVGSEKAVTIQELAQRILSLENSGQKIKLEGAATGTLSGDRYIPSTRKARQELGLELRVDEAKALRKTFDYYKKMAEKK